jgi:hypothetical protein
MIRLRQHVFWLYARDPPSLCGFSGTLRMIIREELSPPEEP